MPQQINFKIRPDRKQAMQLWCLYHGVSMSGILLAFVEKSLIPTPDKIEKAFLESCVLQAKTHRAEVTAP